MPVNGFGWHERDVAPPTSDELLETNRRWYEHAINAVRDRQRSMFESNFPVDQARRARYTVLWNQFKKLTAGFDPADRAALFHDTALRVYRLQRR